MEAELVEVGGRQYKRMKDPSNGHYFSLSGELVVPRHLYRDVEVRNGPTVVPLELRAGIVNERWTPEAADALGHLHQALPSREVANTCERLKVLPFSRSSLERGGDHLGSEWEKHRGPGEDYIIEKMVIPEEAAAISVAVDRVSLPMEEPLEPEQQQRALTACTNDAVSPTKGVEADTATAGPVDPEASVHDDPKKSEDGPKVKVAYHYAYCACITFHDRDGEPLESIRYGRMPYEGGGPLEETLEADINALMARRPDLSVVGLADGAPEMQNLLSRVLEGHEPAGIAIDLWHNLEKLGAAVVSTGRDADKYLPGWGKDLKMDDRAIERIEMHIRTWLCDYHEDDVPDALYDAFTYIDNNRERMRYASLKKQNLPIGSGHVEATCKTLVSVRMKRSGARWKDSGGQACLNLRSLALSTRWSDAMDHLLGSYVHRVTPVAIAA